MWIHQTDHKSFFVPQRPIFNLEEAFNPSETSSNLTSDHIYPVPSLKKREIQALLNQQGGIHTVVSHLQNPQSRENIVQFFDRCLTGKETYQRCATVLARHPLFIAHFPERILAFVQTVCQNGNPQKALPVVRQMHILVPPPPLAIYEAAISCLQEHLSLPREIIVGETGMLTAQLTNREIQNILRRPDFKEKLDYLLKSDHGARIAEYYDHCIQHGPLKHAERIIFQPEFIRQFPNRIVPFIEHACVHSQASRALTLFGKIEKLTFPITPEIYTEATNTLIKYDVFPDFEVIKKGRAEIRAAYRRLTTNILPAPRSPVQEETALSTPQGEPSPKDITQTSTSSSPLLLRFPPKKELTPTEIRTILESNNESAIAALFKFLARRKSVLRFLGQCLHEKDWNTARKIVSHPSFVKNFPNEVIIFLEQACIHKQVQQALDLITTIESMSDLPLPCKEAIDYFNQNLSPDDQGHEMLMANIANGILSKKISEAEEKIAAAEKETKRKSAPPEEKPPPASKPKIASILPQTPEGQKRLPFSVIKRNASSGKTHLILRHLAGRPDNQERLSLGFGEMLAEAERLLEENQLTEAELSPLLSLSTLPAFIKLFPDRVIDVLKSDITKHNLFAISHIPGTTTRQQQGLPQTIRLEAVNLFSQGILDQEETLSPTNFRNLLRFAARLGHRTIRTYMLEGEKKRIKELFGSAQYQTDLEPLKEQISEGAAYLMKKVNQTYDKHFRNVQPALGNEASYHTVIDPLLQNPARRYQLTRFADFCLAREDVTNGAALCLNPDFTILYPGRAVAMIELAIKIGDPEIAQQISDIMKACQPLTRNFQGNYFKPYIQMAEELLISPENN